jgi:hypothetical protein
MAPLYGEAGWGHHNIMNNNALHNFSSEDSQAGTGNANISMNPLHNMHHALLMQQQMALLAQQTQAQQQQSGASNANVSMNVYGNLGGNMGNDSSSSVRNRAANAAADGALGAANAGASICEHPPAPAAPAAAVPW